jgi:serine/threonine-protein kinase
MTPVPFGPYELLERLGEGAQGDVHLARRGSDPTPLVIKRLAPRLADNERSVRRFRHEATVATAVDSPNVVRVFDVGRIDDRLYIAMEHIPGWPLSKVITTLRKGNDRAALDAIAEIVTGALEGLSALHLAVGDGGSDLRVVHRDVAPKNLMLSESGVTKVIDLGIGKSSQQDWLTATGVTMGTPGYMSPEQTRGARVDARTDVYAMGVVLFELLTLERYLPGRDIPLLLAATLKGAYRPPSSIRADVPPELDAIVERAVAIDPERRFGTAREMAGAIRSIVPAEPGGAAQELIQRLAFDDMAKTKAVVVARMAAPVSPARATSTGEVFSARSAFATTVPPIDAGPDLRRPRAPLGFLGGLVTGVLLAGGFALVWTGARPAPAPITTSEPKAPITGEAPKAIARTPAARPIDSAPSAPRRPRLKLDEPAPPAPVASPPAQVDPPRPPPTQPELRRAVNRMLAATAELSEKGPPEVRGAAKTLGARLNRMLVGDLSAGDVDECAQELEQLRR